MTADSDVRSNNIAQSNQDRVRRVLSTFSNIELAVIFGSMAVGQENQESDVDVAVMATHALSFDQHIKIIDALALELGRPVDLIDLKKVGLSLLNQIVANGRLVLGSTDAWANLIYRNLVDQADFMPLQRRLLKERQDAWIAT
jgi:predicted nucleotidyltransferase